MIEHRFIQIGDLHLKPGDRNDDRKAALDYVIEHSRTLGPIAAWLWPGDLNHAAMSIDDRNWLLDRVLLIAEVAPVVILPGNHDLRGELAFLTALRATWPIYVVQSPQVLSFHTAPAGRGTTPQTRVSIFCLPYPNKGQLVSLGVPHDELNAAASHALDVLCMKGAETLAKCASEGDLTMVLGHVNIGGAISSVGQPQIGQELELGVAQLARFHECFMGFNHIHKHQQVANAWYAGSLCRLDWGEIEPKGYLEIVYTGHEVLTHEVKFVPVPVAPMYHVEGDLSRDGFIWKVKQGPDGPEDEPPSRACDCHSDGCDVCHDGRIVDWTGCDVRVRMRYPSQERVVLEDAKRKVALIFAGARRLDIEPLPVSVRELRAPEVVQSTSLADKLKAWAKVSNVTWSDQIETCAERLLATDDVQLVHDVDVRLAKLTDLNEEQEATSAP